MEATLIDSAPGMRGRVSRALPLLERLVPDVAELEDHDLVAASGEIEALGRHLDALRIRIAGEIDARSDRETSGRAPEDRLCVRVGCANAAEVSARTTHVSEREIRARVRLDRRTRPAISLTGETLPAAYPVVAAALHSGSIGVDIAAHLTDELDRAERRAVVSPAERAAAEREIITATVTGIGGAASDEPLPGTFDDVRIMTTAWCDFLTRDGMEPSAERAAKHRSLTLGRPRDGLVPLRGDLVPEAAAGLQRLLDAHAGSPTTQFLASPEDAAEGEAWTADEHIHDPRTAAQRRHDVLVSIIQTAASAVDAPRIGAAAPTLLVSVRADELDGGVCDLDGVDVAAPSSLAHRIACTGAVQKIVFDSAGRIVRLGSKERLFNAHQRRAIAVRDGGCIIPGCSIPAAWCEIHHVEEHARGGPTHPDNGVLLCWSHHHNLENSGWDIRMREGVPWVKAPPWIDPRGLLRPVRNLRTERERVRRRVRTPQRELVGANR